VLAGRDRKKLDEAQKTIEQKGGSAVSVVSDLSDIASVRGEWMPGGSKTPGADAYATSKQCTLATATAFARENPRLQKGRRSNSTVPSWWSRRHRSNDCLAALWGQSLDQCRTH
jgi:hypothetical protein